MKVLILLGLDGSLLLLAGFAIFSTFRFMDKEDKLDKVFLYTIAVFCLVLAIAATIGIVNG